MEQRHVAIRFPVNVGDRNAADADIRLVPAKAI